MAIQSTSQTVKYLLTFSWQRSWQSLTTDYAYESDDITDRHIQWAAKGNKRKGSARFYRHQLRGCHREPEREG